MSQKKIVYITSLLLFLLSSLTSCQNDGDSSKTAYPATKSEENLLLSWRTSKDSVRAKGVLSVNEVKILLRKEPNIIIFEVSKSTEFEKKHLATAQNLWRPDYGSKANSLYGGMHASREEMEYLLSKRGVSADSKIIIYDVKGGCDAVRLAWILRGYGHEETYVMNGGKTAWQQANLPMTQAVSDYPRMTDYKFISLHKILEFADIETVKKAINNPDYVILDTREEKEFFGQPYLSKGEIYPWKKGAFTFGCIPGAIHLDWSDAVDMSVDHRFKCLKDLEYNFECAGVTPDKKIIVYCQSGVRSAHTAFVLKEILGYPNVKNYDGSWIEWSYHYMTKNDVQVERHISEDAHELMLAELKKSLHLPKE